MSNPDMDILRKGLAVHLKNLKNDDAYVVVQNDFDEQFGPPQELAIRSLFFDTTTLDIQITANEKLLETEKRRNARISEELEEAKSVLIKQGQLFVNGISGKKFTILVDLERNSVEHLKLFIYEREGVPPSKQVLNFAGRTLEDGHSLHHYRIKKESTIHLVLGLRGGNCMAYCLHESEFSSKFNCDFRGYTADMEKFERGGYTYNRPIGSKRLALKVLGKYQDDEWLGKDGNRTFSCKGEWPVAYHGTTDPRAAEIVKSGGLKLEKGNRFLYGKGIYCTPDPQTALSYAHTFEFKNQMFKLIFQARVDPSRKKVITTAERGNDGLGDYWIVSEDDAIRPYGICIYPC